MAKTQISIRLETKEKELLDQYCLLTDRTQTDVIRELIRSLKRRMPKN
ncbi:MAG: ribbon-helix-helix protein, CopG family [Xenococcaceae cyanobacterium MO_207.B15]|nr:ribbon-helix-helix protein, CopG family [Xenococcaceae cyanobacterium MO_207.B15]MDJ0747166.1 ribbon-helix-helix protein, CopG family [Xenococcaceae cyanobacterium MO_167.B27]